MDFLNKAMAQVKDLFSTMTPGARITAGLLLAVVVISLAYLFQMGTGSPDEFLLGGRPLSSSELAAMEGAFAKAGLSNYQIEGNRVRIPRGQKAAYVGALADGDALPADFNGYFQEVSSNTNVFETGVQYAQRLKIAKQQELALIIRSMRGIDHATVQYDEITKGGFPRTKEVTAMVAVQPSGSSELDEQRVRSIRNLVSRAIAGLKPENVSVTDFNTGMTYGPSVGPDGTSSADDDPYLARKKKYEQEWVDKLVKAVSFVSGAIVQVNVELNDELHHSESSVKFDPKVVPIETSEQSSTSNSSTPQPAGPPGAATQAANSPRSISSRAEATSTEEKTTSKQQNIASQDQTSVVKASLIPTRVTATVGVPSSYYVKVWRERNPTPAGQPAKDPDPAELVKIEEEVRKKVEDTVVQLLPKRPAGVDPYPQVNVTTFTQLTAEPIPAPSMASEAIGWLADNWSTLGMTLVGMFSLLMLRSMVRSTPSSPPPSAAAAGQPSLSVVSADDEDGEKGEAAGDRRMRRFQAGGPNLRQELAELVREDPAAAATILRNWIGDVA